MKSCFLMLVFALATTAGCTKANPDRCCTDEADCTSNNIAVGSTCDEGLLCRGHQCISIPCDRSAQCDEAAPYCVASTCLEQCTEDTQCPGYGQALSSPYCVGGACVECRDSTDCASDSPVCDAGVCRKCAEHSECATNACTPAGTCATESEIAYVETTGSTTSDCTRIAPCSTLARAFALTPPRPYVVIGSGTYSSTSAISPVGERWLIGRTGSPVFTRSTPGPIFLLSSVELHLDTVTITGATTNGTDAGIGIQCQSGVPILFLNNVVVKDNDSFGLYGAGCNVTATRSTFSGNGLTSGGAVELSGSPATFDRCLIVQNGNGLVLDDGLFTVTNNIIARNGNGGSIAGLFIYSNDPVGHRIEFNTIVDNTNGVNAFGINCALTTPIDLTNNIIARNKKQTNGPCTHPGSIIVDSDISTLKFKSPDASPYDYHLTAGSTAIDTAIGASSLKADLDGDPRPSGAARDVGADEYVP